MFMENVGSIRTQIGASLSSIREATSEGNVEKVADQVALLLALASPKLKPDYRRELVMPELEPGRDKDGSRSRKLFRELMALVERILSGLAEEGIYAKVDAPISDGSGLALASEEDGEEDVVVLE